MARFVAYDVFAFLGISNMCTFVCFPFSDEVFARSVASRGPGSGRPRFRVRVVVHLYEKEISQQRMNGRTDEYLAHHRIAGERKRKKILTMSTFSRDIPDDSYRKNQTTTAPRRLQAAKTNPYRNFIDETMNGVKNARRKF